MLIEIRSQVFNEKVIRFHKGLNAILGDAEAANSIGKSTLLMIVDFVFGGSAFLDHNGDVVQELGHHSYEFAFQFRERMYFSRSTNSPNTVQTCGSDYLQTGTISRAGFLELLHAQYLPSVESLTLRAAVGPYSRVWPKDNVMSVKRPLHSASTQKTELSIENLIKLFGRYSEISEVSKAATLKNEERSALRSAQAYEIVEKINKPRFVQNQAELKKLDDEISEIKHEMARFAINVRQLLDRDLLARKNQKDLLLQTKFKLEQRLAVTRRNLGRQKKISIAQFDGLEKFFPNVDSDRLAKVEGFHNSVASMLSDELRSAQRNLEAQLNEVDEEIAKIDAEMSEKLSNHDNPASLVDRVYGLSGRYSKLRAENHQFEKAELISEDLKKLKSELTELKEVVVLEISATVNGELHRIVKRVYGDDGKVPQFYLEESAYTFSVFDDTGTGKAFASLVIFDLAILELTPLPIVLHDLPLFKNVENRAVSSLLEEYALHMDKQCFVVLDEIAKYGKETVNLLESNMVIQLTNNHQLFIKDWRRGA